jgi:hypothetical protein
MNGMQTNTIGHSQYVRNSIINTEVNAINGIIDLVDNRPKIRTAGTNQSSLSLLANSIDPGMNSNRTLAVIVGHPRNEYALGKKNAS